MILAQFIISLIVIIIGILIFVCLLANQALVEKTRKAVDEEHRKAEENPETERKDIKGVNTDINNIQIFNNK